MSVDDAVLYENGKEKETVEGTVEGEAINVVGYPQLKGMWYGKRKRPTKLYAPFYNGLAAAMSIGSYSLPSLLTACLIFLEQYLSVMEYELYFGNTNSTEI
jgi:hypothetical protein